MRYSRWSTTLRAVTWLAVAVTLGLSADLVEDTLFEIDEASAAEGAIQDEAAADVAVPAPRLLGSTSPDHPLLPLSHETAFLGPIGLPLDNLLLGLALIHGPPWASPRRSVSISLPLRI